MKPAFLPARRGAAFTLIELMVGMAIGSVVLAGLGVTMVSLQRSFEAANYQMTAQNDQLRVLDYVSRDARTATTLAVSDGGGTLSLTLPSGDTGTLNLALGPTLTSLLGTSGNSTGTQKVAYYVQGGAFIRECNGVQTDLADTVDGVTFSRDGSFLTTSILFTPPFSHSPTTVPQPNTRASNQIYLRNLPATN